MKSNKTKVNKSPRFFINDRAPKYKETFIITFIFFVLFVLSIQFDSFEMLTQFVSQHEEYELDELVMLVLFSSVAFMVIIIRKNRQLKSEVTLRQRTENELNKMAFYDELTGLPNRSLCKNRLTQFISQAKRNAKIGAVFFIDLDNFKYVNDSYGHGCGDELLKKFSGRILNQLRTEDTLARISGDEFVVIIGSPANLSGIGVIAEKLIASLNQPFLLNDEEIFTNMSIGISVYPDDADSADGLFKCADTAMYNAKHDGKSTYRFYSASLEQQAQYKLKINNKLRKVLENNELILNYQPIFDVKSKRIVGAEALLRWDNPELGLVPPDVFIPIAEEAGLMDDIGSWVVKQACWQNKQWQLHGYSALIISVNMSAKQLSSPHFVSKIEDALHRADLAPHYLEMELTETALLKDVDSALDKLAELKSLGVTIALDDFGTGYSSMSYLVKLNINRLKVDRSFIENVPHGTDDVITTKAIIALAKNLNLKVTAEGIENVEQQTFLENTLCDSVQGYLFSRPLNAEDFLQYLNQYNS